MNSFLFLAIFLGEFFIPIEKLKSNKQFIDNQVNSYYFDRLQWYSKLKGKEELVWVRDRYTFEQEIEYNIGIFKIGNCTALAVKEYFGDLSTYSTSESYYYDFNGNLYATAYFCTHFQNTCNKNDHSYHQVISYFINSELTSSYQKMWKEKNKQISIVKCENPFYEEVTPIFTVSEFFKKYKAEQ